MTQTISMKYKLGTYYFLKSLKMPYKIKENMLSYNLNTKNAH